MLTCTHSGRPWRRLSLFGRAAGTEGVSADPREAKKTLTLIALLALYFAGNLVLSWMRYCLFGSRHPVGLTEGILGERLYRIYSACLPIALWGLVLYVLALRWPRLLGRKAITVLALLALLAIDLDMAWYTMSLRHAGWTDLTVFLGGSWQSHFGIRSSDVWQFVGRAARHGLVCGFIYLVSSLLYVRRPFRWLCQVRPALLGAAVLVLTAADLVVVGHYVAREQPDQEQGPWIAAVERNPLRLRALDRAWDLLSGSDQDIELANRRLAEEVPASETTAPAAPRLPAPPRPYNVVVIGIESCSRRLVEETDLPNWRALARRSTVLQEHYSTGNCTQYGVLGLLFGSPVTFYRGAETEGIAGSPYVDLFRRHGYRSRWVGSPVASWCNMGRYLENLTEPALETTDVEQIIPTVRSELGRAGNAFLFVFYYNTHWPYLHAPSFASYQPEVPPEFNYSRWDLPEHRQPIENRYRNCLAELDAWLGRLLAVIDLDNTVVVVVGDHGEEFFESGRLGHASRLNEAQTRTSCLIYVPGGAGQRLDFVTSHADVLPSVFDVLGWDGPPQLHGHSVFRPGQERAAVCAQTRHCNPARNWKVVTREGKVSVEGGRGDRLRITGLTDRLDVPQQFQADPQRWQAAFSQVRKLQETLDRP